MGEPETHPPFLRYQAGQWETLRRGVIVEKPVGLTVNGQVWMTLMCTPTDLEALAIGFLFNEGTIKSKDEIDLVQVCPQGDNVDVWLKHPVEPPQQWQRTSGCMSGTTAVVSERLLPQIKNGFVLAPETINRLVHMLSGAQKLYREVGGVHTAVLSDGERVLVSAEDVGRHNALDKIAGRILLEEARLLRRILVTTGRISSEMVQKAARLGASIFISRSSASSLAITLAEKWDITLVGYARNDQFIVYTHSERIPQNGVSVIAEPTSKEA